MTEREIEDGVILGRLLEHEDFWPALQRVVKTLEDDAIKQFCDGEGKSKKWLMGAREMALAIIPAIVTRAQDAETAIQERKEQQEVVRSRGDDGTGSGDLAL